MDASDVRRAVKDARVQTVVIECHESGREWWVLFGDGSVDVYGTPSKALRAVKAAAARGNRGVTITAIEWRDVPDGFSPSALA